MVEIGHFGHLFLHPVQIRWISWDDSIDITHGDLRETVGEKKLCDCNSGTSGTIYNNFTVFFFLAGYFQGVDDACQNDDGGSVLVIVEYRDIKKFF